MAELSPGRCAGSIALAMTLGLFSTAARAGGPLDPEFDAIVSSTTQQNHPAVIAKMQSWIDVHPGDPQIPRALLWMAQLERGDGHADRAVPLLERALASGAGTDWALHAEKQLADIDVESHRYGRAIAVYDRLANGGNDFWQYVGKSAGAEARSRRARFYALIATLAVLLGVAFGRFVRIGPRALWPLPDELAYPLPALLVILIAAAAQEPAEMRGVITLALGAIVLLWINGAWLRRHPPQGGQRFLQAALGVAQALGLFYCAIVSSGLWEKLVDTWQMGAD